MRLSPNEIVAIKSAVHERDPEAEIYLFGSRADPEQKGGDIDILVISNRLEAIDRIPIKARIFREMEEQKIDLLISQDRSDPFVKIALKTGVPL